MVARTAVYLGTFVFCSQLLSVMSPHVFSLVQRHIPTFLLVEGWTTRQPCGDWDLLTEFDLKQFHSKTVPVRSQIELFVIV